MLDTAIDKLRQKTLKRYISPGLGRVLIYGTLHGSSTSPGIKLIYDNMVIAARMPLDGQVLEMVSISVWCGPES